MRVHAADVHEEVVRGDVRAVAGRGAAHVRLVQRREQRRARRGRRQRLRRAAHAAAQLQAPPRAQEKRQYIQIAVALLPPRRLRRVPPPIQMIHVLETLTPSAPIPPLRVTRFPTQHIVQVKLSSSGQLGNQMNFFDVQSNCTSVISLILK